MMLTILVNLAGTLLLGLAALVNPITDTTDLTYGRGPGGPGGPGGPRGPIDPPAVVVTPLSDAEATELLFIREEEKLARDVYLVMYDLWGIPAFSNIAKAEQTHMDAVLRLINRYGLVDPVGANAPGVFSDPELQAMYDDLIAKGSQSAVDAIEVGVAIEEADIADLEAAMDAATHSDILRVYSRLLRGSQNHLAAFSSLLP